jgi:hypothetical protein
MFGAVVEIELFARAPFVRSYHQHEFVADALQAQENAQCAPTWPTPMIPIFFVMDDHPFVMNAYFGSGVPVHYTQGKEMRPFFRRGNTTAADEKRRIYRENFAGKVDPTVCWVCIMWSY